MPIITMMDNLQNSVSNKINEDLPSSAINSLSNFNPESPFHYNEDENDDIFNDLDDPEPTLSNVLSHIVSKTCESSINSIEVSNVQNMNESKYDECIAPNNGSQNNIVLKEYPILKQTENIVKVKSSVKGTSCYFEEDSSVPELNESSIQNNEININLLNVCSEVVNSCSNYDDTNNVQKDQLEQTNEKHKLSTFEDKTQTNNSAVEKLDVEEERDLNAQNNIPELIKKNDDQDLVEPLCNSKSSSLEVQFTTDIVNNSSNGNETMSNVSKSLVENKSPIDLNRSVVDAIEVELNIIHGEGSSNSNFNKEPIVTHSMTKTTNSYVSDGSDLEDVIYSQIDYIISQCSTSISPATKSTKSINNSKSKPISILEGNMHEKIFKNTNFDKNASCYLDSKTSTPMCDSNSVQGDKIISDDIVTNNNRGPVQSHEIHDDKNHINDDESQPQNEIITDDMTNNDKSPVQSHEICDDNVDLNYGQSSILSSNASNVEINYDKSPIQGCKLNSDISNNGDPGNDKYIVQNNDTSSVQSLEVCSDNDDQGSTLNNDLITDSVEMNYNKSPVQNCEPNSDISNNDDVENDKYLVQNNDTSSVQSLEVCSGNNDQGSTLNNDTIIDDVEMNCNKSPVQSCEPNSDISNDDDIENDKYLVQNNDTSSVRSLEVCSDNNDQGSTLNNDPIIDDVEMNCNKSPVQSCEPNSDISNNDDIENDKYIIQDNDMSIVECHEICNDNDDQGTTQNNELITNNVKMNYNKIPLRSCETNSDVSNNDKYLVQSHEVHNDFDNQDSSQNNEFISDNVEINYNKSDKLSTDILNVNNDNSTVQSNTVIASTTSNNTSESYLMLKEKQIKSISLNISSLITEHIKNVVLKCSEYNKLKPFNVDSSRQLDQSVTADTSTIVESILDNLTNKKTDLTKKIIKVLDISLDSIYYNEKKNVDNILPRTTSKNTLNLSTNDTEHNGSSEKENHQQEETSSFSTFFPKDVFIQLMRDFNEDVKNVSVSKKSVINLEKETELCSTDPQLKCLPLSDSNIEGKTLNVNKENSIQCSMKLSHLSKNTINTSNDIEQVNLLPRRMNKSPKTSTRSSPKCIKNSLESTKRTNPKRFLRHNRINISSDFSEYESEDSSTSIWSKSNKDKIKNKSSKKSLSVHFSTIKNQEENKIFVTENSKPKKHTTGRKRAAETPISPPKAKISKRTSLSKVESSTISVSDSPKVCIGPDVMLTLKSSKPSLMPVLGNSILEKIKKEKETQKSKKDTKSKKRKLSYSSDDSSSSVEVLTRRSTVKKTVCKESPKSIPTKSRTKKQNVDKFSLSSEASSPEVNVLTNKIHTRRSCKPSLMQVSDNYILEGKKKKRETQKYNEKTQSKKQKLSCSSDDSSSSIKLITRQSTIKKNEDKEGSKSIPTTSRTKNQRVDKFNLNNEAKFNKVTLTIIPKAKKKPSSSRVLRTKKKINL